MAENDDESPTGVTLPWSVITWLAGGALVAFGMFFGLGEWHSSNNQDIINNRNRIAANEQTMATVTAQIGAVTNKLDDALLEWRVLTEQVGALRRQSDQIGVDLRDGGRHSEELGTQIHHLEVTVGAIDERVKTLGGIIQSAITPAPREGRGRNPQ